MGPERPELGPGIRSISLSPYVIYYEVTDEAVIILRVLHGARDPHVQFGIG
jgi:toxin ParE1/3/4